jgi:cell division protease FtsH
MFKKFLLIFIYLNTTCCSKLKNAKTVSKIAMYGAITGFFIKLMVDMHGKENEEIDKIKNYTPPETNKITFKDIIGLKEAKKELQDYINFVKNPAKYKKFGCKFPRGILLTGSPGNGKTYLANAFAGELKCEFYNLSANDLKSKYYGETEQNIKALFDNCPKDAPVVIFIDEIDAIGAKRKTANNDYDQHTNSILDELLIQIDRLEKLNVPTFIVAATNNIDWLDDALIRPGRFDKIINLENPHTEERVKFFEEFTTRLPLSEKFDLDYAAELTAGYSFAKMQSLINQASLIALRRDGEKIEFADFEEAIDTYDVGLKKELKLSDQQLLELAFHEAGHTLAAVLLDLPYKINKVTISARGKAAGFTQIVDNGCGNYSKSELLNIITMLLCGRIGQELYTNEIDTGAADDLAKATNLAQKLVCDFGMHESTIRVIDDYQAKYSTTTQDAIEAVLKDCYAQGKQLLEDNYHKLEMLAHGLVKKKSLSRNEIIQILDN